MHSIKKQCSSIQESLISRYLGWKQIKGSGSRPLHPGDISNQRWLGECKTHITANYPLKFNFDVWDKISEEAQSQFKLPVLFVDDGSQLIQNTWCMIKLPSQPEDVKIFADCSNKSSFMRTLESLTSIKDGFIVIQRNLDFYGILPLDLFKSIVENEEVGL